MSPLHVDDLAGVLNELDTKTTILGAIAAFALYRVYVVLSGFKVRFDVLICPQNRLTRSLNY